MIFLYVSIAFLAGLLLGGLVTYMLSASTARDLRISQERIRKLEFAQMEAEAYKLSVVRKEAEASAMAEGWQNEVRVLKESHAAEKEMWEKSSENLQKQFNENRDEMEKSWKAKIELMREEFKNLSDKILSEKSAAMQNTNKEQIDTILAPLRTKLDDFRKSVEESREKGVEINTELRSQLARMMEETKRIGTDANNLATVLKGEQKTQGDWGEMILEDILKRAGLIEGVHYECQKTMRDEASGQFVKSDDDKLMRPDVVVHYPDGKDVIIDSKVSLSAYVEYMNAETEADKKAALARHLKSVRAHVTELKKKDYSGLFRGISREAVDFVIMFIPNEAPCQLAMLSDPNLWNEAFDNRVVIVSPVNLMALLQLIHLAWTRADQDRNQQDIMDTASQLLDRLYSFYADFDKVGDQLQKTLLAYDGSLRKLKQGERNQSVVRSGERMKELGVKMKKRRPLPPRFRNEDSAFPASAPELPLDIPVAEIPLQSAPAEDR